MRHTGAKMSDADATFCRALEPRMLVARVVAEDLLAEGVV